jgi:hypothetical protein
VWDDLQLRLERGQGALQIFRVPENHGGDKQVETGRSEELILEGTVAQLTEAVKEDRPSKGIARLALKATRRRARWSARSEVRQFSNIPKIRR